MQKNIQQIILENNDKRVGNTFCIAVDGRGGSGKTTLAKILSRKFNAEVIHTDDFASWDNPIDWYAEVLKRVFEPIKNGEKYISYKRSSWASKHKPKPIINQPITEIMIIEGVGSSRKEFQKYIGLKIFVDTPKKICLKRGLERDRGQYTENELQANWQEWVKTEEQHFAENNTKERSDIIVSGVNHSYFEKL